MPPPLHGRMSLSGAAEDTAEAVHPRRENESGVTEREEKRRKQNRNAVVLQVRHKADARLFVRDTRPVWRVSQAAVERGGSVPRDDTDVCAIYETVSLRERESCI